MDVKVLRVTKATVILAIATGIGKTYTNHANCLNKRIVFSFAEGKSSPSTISWVKTNAEMFEKKTEISNRDRKEKATEVRKNTQNNNKTIIKE